MRNALALVTLLAGTIGASAGTIVDYVVDAGGTNHNPLNGLAARAEFEISGNQLTILLENSSTGIPTGFGAAQQLLVSLGMNLPTGVNFASGDTAVIGAGSAGVGSWASRSAGASVAEQWNWTNFGAGDVLAAYRNVLTTSSGSPPGAVGFGGHHKNVGGPYGGIAPDPLLVSIPTNQPAVRNSILFSLTLTAPISEAELAAVAADSIVEFGSDARYLRVPEPASIALAGLAVFAVRRRQ